MVIFSAFDGISAAKLALEQAGIPTTKYYASEIDKHAIRISKGNWKDIIQLGDIRNITANMIPDKIDLLIGGSPCQDLSALNKNGKGLEGNKSELFYEFVRLKNELKPKYFLLENVASMSNENKNKISEALGVEPIKINSALLTAQNRNRYYWTNIMGITQSKDENVLLEDIIESGFTEKKKASCLTASYASSSVYNHFLRDERTRIWTVPVTASTTIISGFTNSTYITPNETYKIVYSKKEKYINQKERNQETLEKLKLITRKLTVSECEKLQGLPYRYTYHTSDRQQYKAIGNGFTVPVISHILSFIPKENLTSG